MMRVPQPTGERGSLRWIQVCTNEWADEFSALVASASGGRIADSIAWLSPRREDGLAEYRDQSFLDILGVSPSVLPLDRFWPRRGPQWDALGRSPSGELVLVEAKAHLSEIVSPASGASDESLGRIRSALSDTAAAFGVVPTCDWTSTFYQYANRLAHLYYLREINQLPAWLVFVYFTGDEEMKGPRTEAEWRAALVILYAALGLRRGGLLKYVVHVFPSVQRIAGEAGAPGAG